MRIMLVCLAVLLLAALGASTFYAVDQGELVYVTQFGRHVATRDGAVDAGLWWKLPWPVQSVQRISRKLHVFDLPDTELLTHDKEGKTIDRTLNVGAYVCWRIAGPEGVDRFIRAMGTTERAQQILGQRVAARIGAEISRMPIEDLVGVADARELDRRVERLRDRLLGESDGIREQARAEYGIEVVDVRLRRFNHPDSVRGEILDRIASERKKKAADYRSQGMLEAQVIKSEAERRAREIETDAESTARRLRAEAAVEADAIRNQAHAQDPEFYAFLQKLEAYKKILGGAADQGRKVQDTLLLSSRHELFDMLLKPPRPADSGGQLPSPATNPAGNP